MQIHVFKMASINFYYTLHCIIEKKLAEMRWPPYLCRKTPNFEEKRVFGVIPSRPQPQHSILTIYIVAPQRLIYCCSCTSLHFRFCFLNPVMLLVWGVLPNLFPTIFRFSSNNRAITILKHEKTIFATILHYLRIQL